MNSQWILRGLVATILMQTGVLAAEYLNSVYPLWTGQEIRLKTVPVDPRSLFRGNYVRLSYEISEIAENDLSKEIPARPLRSNEIIYVKLKRMENDIYEFDGASPSKPETGLFIRGRIQSPRLPGATQTIQLRYGIEAFFAPTKKALALEDQLRNGGIAVVMLADNGKAALKHVLADDAAHRVGPAQVIE